MNARKPDPATVAFDALALDALRRTSRGGDVQASDDAPTQLYLRARAPRVRPTLQTMTVRAVAALGHASSSARRVRRKVSQHRARRRTRWSLALAGTAFAGCVAAALTAVLMTSPPVRTSTHAAKTIDAPPSQPAPSAVSAPVAATPTPPTAVPADRVVAGSSAPAAAAVAPHVKGMRVRRAQPASTASAADALAAGDYRIALARYRELAAREPEQPAFAAIVRLLERDLARSCDPTSASAGSECGR